MPLLHDLLQSLFTGFAVFILISSFIRFKQEKRNALITSLTESATLIASVTAVVFLITWLIDSYTTIQLEEEYYSTITRLTGPYWLGYWVYPFCYGIFPQLLWIKKIREKKAMRVITAVLFMYALYMNKIVIWITSFHRDYVPSSWTMISGYVFIYDWVVSFIIFGHALGVVHLLKLKLAKSVQ